MRPRAYAERKRPGTTGRRPRRRLVAPAAAACAALAALAPAAEAAIGPELGDALRRALPDQRIPAIATLESRAPPGPGAPAPAIVRALRREAARTQPGVEARTGLSGSARGHWLVNAISVRATPREIRRLADDAAVARVDLDPRIAVAPEPAPRARLLQAGGRNWGLAAVRAPDAWREVGATGASVRIGTIDTGVDPGHPALLGKVAGWSDLVAGRPSPYDDHGHGTHTAGILAGGDLGSPLGVAPGAKLLVAKAIPRSGVGSGTDVLEAAEWLADPDGNPATADFPQVISNSWGEVADPNDPWFRPVLRRWQALGIVAVFAAGNTGPRAGSVGSPGGYPEALAVGAVDRDRRVPPFSSRGPVEWQNRDGAGPAPGLVPKPDIAAPGAGIVSSTGGGYQAYSGTSMASPHVAGVAALVRSANPSLAAAQVEQILRATAADIGTPGRDNDTGAGLVDALAATRLAARGAPRRRVARTPSRRKAVRLTLAQLRINHRIALTAVRRVEDLQRRLGMFAVVGGATAAARRPIARLSAAEMARSQRLAQAALRGAAAVEARLDGAPGPPPPAGRGGAVRLTTRQLLINQRIAQAALRRAREAELRAQAAGLLPPG